MLVESGESLARWWPYVRDYLADALRHSVQHEWTVDEVHDRIATGEFLLALVLRDAAVIGAQVFARGTDAQGRRYVGMVCCGGFDLDEWLPGLVALSKKLCELHEAERIVIFGRRGWERTLYAHGLRVEAVVLAARTEDIVTDVEFAKLTGDDHG
jgi:hypothetical protein